MGFCLVAARGATLCSRVWAFLMAVAPLVGEHRFWGARTSAVAAAGI